MNLYAFETISVLTKRYGAVGVQDCHEFIDEAKEYLFSKNPLVALHVFQRHIGIDLTLAIRIVGYLESGWAASYSPMVTREQQVLILAFVESSKFLTYDEAAPIAIRLVEDLLDTLVPK